MHGDRRVRLDEGAPTLWDGAAAATREERDQRNQRQQEQQWVNCDPAHQGQHEQNRNQGNEHLPLLPSLNPVAEGYPAAARVNGVRD
jgi:hypothetical protein